MQRKDGKRGRKLTGMLAVLLAMGLAAAAVFPMSARADNLNLDSDCSITLKLPESYANADEEISSSIDLDVYQIAKAAPVTGYDSYSFVLGEDFGTLQARLDKLTDADDDDDDGIEAEKFASDAAGIIDDKSVKPVKSGKPEEKLTVDPGLYLVLVQGDFEEAEDGSVVTTVLTRRNKFSFKPVLVSLPTKADGMTSGTGNWIYSISGELKPEMERRVGSLRIEKELRNYTLGKNTTFLFSISYYDEVKKAPVSVEKQLIFDASGVLTPIEVKDIPIDTLVTITENYSGANCSPVLGTAQVMVTGNGGEKLVTQGVTVESATEPAVVRFTNEYNNTYRNEGWIENEFTAVVSDDGSIHWELKSTDHNGNVKSGADWTVQQVEK